MPIDVKQMVIKSSVDHSKGETSNSQPTHTSFSSLKSELLRECERRIVQLIHEARTR